jgi:enolase
MITLHAPLVPTFRATVASLQAHMLAMPDADQVKMEPVHRFADGLYIRELSIPAGTVAIGQEHAQGHVNFLTKGRVEVATDEGMQILQAPATFVSVAGTKKIVHALEDSIWTTVHACEATDPDEAEALLTRPDTPTGFLTVGAVQCLS